MVSNFKIMYIIVLDVSIEKSIRSEKQVCCSGNRIQITLKYNINIIAIYLASILKTSLMNYKYIRHISEMQKKENRNIDVI